MHRLLTQLLVSGLALGVVLGGCSGGSSNEPEPPAGPVGLLRKVSNASELEASIKGGFTRIQSNQSLDSTIGSAPAEAVSGSYSRTYTQELNVDEFDSVKYDGDHIFIAPMRQTFPCCFLAAEPFAGSVAPPPAERSIRILATDPATAGATEVSNIPLDDEISVQGLYRTVDRLVALTSRYYYGSYGDAWSSFAIWAPSTSGISVYDTSDITQPTLVFDADFDGIFIESRRVGNIVYVVSRYTPNVPGILYSVTTANDQAANQALLNNIPLADLLPKIRINGQARSLVTPENCLVPSDDVPQYPVITSITAIPISNPSAFTTTCYNDDAYGIYVSETAMYLTQSRFDGQSTRLHKFSITGGTPGYSGSVDIQGIVWTGGQSDFRLSEKDGFLRAFSTRFEPGSSDFVDNFLYVLRESATKPELEIASKLPNASRPEEIGKPNEQLYGVRFVGDRAYAVTFLRIDPLYVIDLSNTADPFVAGTLEISGFSDFLHPVTDNLLLGIGTSENNAVKLELFDVSNIAQPLSLGSDVLGGPGSYSEARYDRHAFSYLADVNGVDRFAIPADLTADDETFRLMESGLYLYEIRDKTMPSLASLTHTGSAVVYRDGDGDEYFYSSRNRSILHDDAVYYIRDDEVFSLLWTDPLTLDGPH